MRASHKLDKGNRRSMLNFIAIEFRLKGDINVLVFYLRL